MEDIALGSVGHKELPSGVTSGGVVRDVVDV